MVPKEFQDIVSAHFGFRGRDVAALVVGSGKPSCLGVGPTQQIITAENRFLSLLIVLGILLFGIGEQRPQLQLQIRDSVLDHTPDYVVVDLRIRVSQSVTRANDRSPRDFRMCFSYLVGNVRDCDT